MSLLIHCAYCGKEIAAKIIASRHYTEDEKSTLTICCDRECSDKRKSRDGIFRRMIRMRKWRKIRGGLLDG